MAMKQSAMNSSDTVQGLVITKVEKHLHPEHA
jgi:hypothetical protein